MRTSEADRQRLRRWFAAGAKLFVVVAVLAGAYLGVSRLVKRTILQNPQYNISSLDVETDGVLNPQDILEASDLHKGANIFRVDLARAQARVASIPQVEKVLVSRQLPNRVAIQVSERKPVAWVAPANNAQPRDDVVASRQSWLADANGVLMRPKKLNPQDRFLPIIRNYNEPSPIEGKEVATEEMKSALDLLRAQAESADQERFQIEEIDLAKHFGLVVTDRNGLQVLFGLDEMDRQLKRLAVYLQELDRQAQKPRTINLLVQKNVPVTFMVDAVATDKPAPPPPPAAASPTPGAASGKDKAKPKPKTTERSKEKGHGKAGSGHGGHRKSAASREQPFLAPSANTSH